jgi:hypothetical protein
MAISSPSAFHVCVDQSGITSSIGASSIRLFVSQGHSLITDIKAIFSHAFCFASPRLPA